MTRLRGYLVAPWPVSLGLAVLALLVRVWTIHAYGAPAYDGGYDLRIYAYFGRLAVSGVDPYTAPAHGPVPGLYGDNQPLELLLFGGLLKLHNSLATLRVAFAVLESVVVALVGLTFTHRSLRWRIAAMTFLAFNPFVLLAWTAEAEDKSISILLLALVIVWVRRDRLWWAWAAAAALLMLKFEGLFIVLPLLVATWRRHGRSPTIRAACAFAACAVAAEAPFFPHSLAALQRRSVRIGAVPTHASWTILLNRVGLYSPVLVRPLIVVALLAVAAAYLKDWIRLEQAVALSFFLAFFFLPDQSVDRIALILVPLLFTMSLTWVRLVAIWLTSLVAAAAVLADQFPLLPLEHLPFQYLSASLYVADAWVPAFWDHIVGAYASVPWAVLTNLVLFAVLGFYAYDLWCDKRAERHSTAEPRAA